MSEDNPYTDENEDKKAAIQMDDIAKTVFAPIYPVIAQQVIRFYGSTTGNCIDLGSGPGALSVCLAKISKLAVYAVDKSVHSFAIADRNIREQGLAERVTPVQSDICNMPFDNNFADLMVSRGSIFFWENLVSAFNEIYRVMKPGGITYIGGGFGSAELKKSIFKQMAQKNDKFEEMSKKRQHPENIMRIKTALKHSHAKHYEITQSEVGFWIHIKKEDRE